MCIAIDPWSWNVVLYLFLDKWLFEFLQIYADQIIQLAKIIQ